MKFLLILGLALAWLVGAVTGVVLIETALADLPSFIRVIVGFAFGFFYTGWLLDIYDKRFPA